MAAGVIIIRQNGKYGGIDETGSVVVPIVYSYLADFIDGYAVAQKNHLWGSVDKADQVVIDFKYDEKFEFRHGLAFVKKNNNVGLINLTGKEICECKYQAIEKFVSQKLNNEFFKVKQNAKYGCINKKGVEVVPVKYESISEILLGVEQVIKNRTIEETTSYSDRLLIGKTETKYDLIDITTSKATEYDLIEDFSCGFAVVKKNGFYGYIDINGIETIPLIYSRAYSFVKHYTIEARVEKDGYWAYINLKGMVKNGWSNRDIQDDLPF